MLKPAPAAIPSLVAPNQRWNLNLAYHRLVLDAVPAHATTALDVGCGDGLLSADLAAADLHVTALDRHQPSVAATARLGRSIEAVEGDVLRGAVTGRRFDVVASNAMLHHVDAVAGVRAMRDLVAPGGVLVIIGFARIERPAEIALAAAGTAVNLMQRWRGRTWDHGAPIVWPPPMTFSAMRALADVELPSSSFRRLLAQRYAITWHAP